MSIRLANNWANSKRFTSATSKTYRNTVLQQYGVAASKTTSVANDALPLLKV
jgi:hypothetical protein